MTPCQAALALILGSTNSMQKGVGTDLRMKYRNLREIGHLNAAHATECSGQLRRCNM
jgi:hypothetical protein